MTPQQLEVIWLDTACQQSSNQLLSHVVPAMRSQLVVFQPNVRDDHKLVITACQSSSIGCAIPLGAALTPSASLR